MTRAAVAAVALAVALALGGCAEAGPGSSGVASPPPAGTGAPPTAGAAAVGSARAELVALLGAENLVLRDAQNPFRPAEGPALAVAPRAVYQVVLPDDPLGGYIVVYDLGDPQRAAAAGAEQAAYLSSGPGRVQTPFGTRHHVRQLDHTLITYSWNPNGATDERAPRIEAALLELGTAIEVPR